MSLRELYQEIIIDHGRAPRNFGQLASCNAQHHGHNPLCGDKLTVYLLEKENKIEEARFAGEGCAISMASASLMTEMIKGKTIPDIKKLFSMFQQLVTIGEIENEDLLGKLAVFAGVAEFPMRVKCATLAWHTLKAALIHEQTVVSTE